MVRLLAGLVARISDEVCQLTCFGPKGRRQVQAWYSDTVSTRTHALPDLQQAISRLQLTENAALQVGSASFRSKQWHVLSMVGGHGEKNAC